MPFAPFVLGMLVVYIGLTATVQGTAISSANSGYWTNTTTWSTATIPSPTDDVTILSGHTITNNDMIVHEVQSLTINSGGILTHARNGTTGSAKLILSMSGNCDVEGAVNVDGKGYYSASGYAGPGVAANWYAGAGHGGKGGRSYSGSYDGGPCYGSVSGPTNLGSTPYTDQVGGGAVILQVGGTMTVNGSISANAAPGLSGLGGASGGSIYLRAGSLAGTGALSANGGQATASGAGYGGGGGGRIAVVLTNGSSFGNVTMTANGHYGYTASAPYHSGGGTIYLQQSNGFSEVVIGNRASVTSYTDIPAGQNWTFDRVTIRSNCIVRARASSTLTLGSNGVLNGQSSTQAMITVTNGGVLWTPTGFAFSNININLDQGAIVSNASTITVESNGVLSLGGGPVTCACDIVLGGTMLHGSSRLFLPGSLTINAGGIYTHPATTTTSALYRIDAVIASNVTIQSGGAINVDSLGYTYPQTGPGSPASQYGGAGHGGMGGTGNANWTGGPAYDSMIAPTNLGSPVSVNSGGGAVLLDIGGALTVNGRISANGQTNSTTGGPSGGSIFIKAGSVAGTNLISANGAWTTMGGPQSGGGGGGRIALILTNSDSFSDVQFSACGGTAPIPATKGGAGTIYLQKADGQSELVLDNAGIDGLYTPIPSPQAWNCDRVTIRANAKLFVTNGASLTVAGNGVLNGASAATALIAVTNGGTLLAPSDFAFSNLNLRLEQGGVLSGVSVMTIQSNGVFSLGGGPVTCACDIVVGGTMLHGSSRLFLAGGLTINAGGVYTHPATIATTLYRIDAVIASNVTIQSGGAINVDYVGYAYPQTGPGAPASQYGGAGHGGMGGTGNANWTGGPAYDSITAPAIPGSAVSVYSGGGAVLLDIAGVLTVNGRVSANGQTNGTSGGPSGGSVFIKAGSVIGTNLISANGAWTTAGGPQSGGGAGGRIALILTNASSFNELRFAAYGGTSPGPATKGGAGTIYLQTAAQGSGEGDLIIDNSNLTAAATTDINSNVTGTAVGTVTIRNNGILRVFSNQTLTVSGSWSNLAGNANFIAGTNSTIVFTGTNSANIYSNNSFFNLACTTPDKALSFQAGCTSVVNGGLTLSRCALYSMTPASYWYLNLIPSGSQDVKRVTVQDSHAGAGQTITNYPPCISLGHNVNWRFMASGMVFCLR